MLGLLWVRMACVDSEGEIGRLVSRRTDYVSRFFESGIMSQRFLTRRHKKDLQIWHGGT